MERCVNFFDPCIYSEVCTDEDLDNLVYFGTDRAVICAHAPTRFERASELIGYLESLTESARERFTRAGLHTHVALGVHPQAAPRRAYDEVWRALPALLADPAVCAIGEVGIDEATPAEYALLERQLRLASTHNLPVLIRLPQRNRSAVLRQLTACARRAAVPFERVMITNPTPADLQRLLTLGVFARVSHHPPELNVSALWTQLAPHVAQVCLSAGMAEGQGDVLAISKAAVALKEAGVDAHTIEQLVTQNAARFLSRSEPASSRSAL